jgi:hypothetical protein
VQIPVIVAGLVVGYAAMSLPAQAACNVRGEFCSHPGWAANAFSHPFDRVPEEWLEYPTNQSAFGYVDRRHVNKRYRKRRGSRR